MPAPATPPVTTRNAVVFLAVLAGGATLYWMQGILTPLALALFLAVMIDSFARVLTTRVPGFPTRAAMPTAMVLSVLLFGVAFWVVIANGRGFFDQLKDYTPRLNEIIARVAHIAGIKVAPTIGGLVNELNPQRFIGQAAASFGNFASSAVLVLIYLGFIIASRKGFGRKIVALFPQHAERERNLKMFQRIRDGVEQYLWIQTVTGLMIAASAFVVMMLLRLDNAFFWAFLIFLAAYIPILGGAIGCFLPPLFALVQFPQSFWPAIILFAALQTIFFVVGNVIYPRMQGESLNMDPTVVLLSLALWGALWGVPGMFLSTPLTVAAMVILAQFDGSRWIAILLSEDGDPQGERAATAATRSTPRKK
ncbi:MULTISPECIES: AI-2E family transporter [Caulobacter]|jgi:predicted PurR-regulated permease PerM|uniref:Putative permease n=1 Tax=Caulobacter vibrioides OR37 TaxID=1292034 RepID=R0EIL0_CAUVI|nr:MULTISPECIES: AI-2E family transporter [Caulobacter]ENZ81017.1 putative permease [Caulobacter vibrioides OR37]MBQ1559400.1 AI-2E family transporter [Caulobacter sp.]